MRYTIIVTAERKENANAFMKQYIDPVGGEYTFTSGLSASGSGEPTHYWASGVATEKQWAIIQPALEAQAEHYQIFNSGETASEILATAGLKIITSNEN